MRAMLALFGVLVAAPALCDELEDPENQIDPALPLASASCRGLGELSLEHHRFSRESSGGQLERVEVVQVLIRNPEGASTPVQLWRREEIYPDIPHVRPRIRAVVECDWRTQDILLVLFSGHALSFSGEMIKLSLESTGHPAGRLPSEVRVAKAQRVGHFAYTPSPMVAGEMLLSSLPLGNRLLLHIESAGKGAYSGTLFLLDFGTGLAQEVRLREAFEGKDDTSTLFDDMPVPGGLPVPWEIVEGTVEERDPASR